MAIRLRLISDESENFVRDVEIDSENTFLDLHNFLQDALGYKNGEMASFFETDNDWTKEIEIPLMDMNPESDDAVITMAEAKLGDYISEAKQRLLYTFDLFSDRNIFIEVFEVDNKKCKDPKVLRSVGDPPKPANMDDILQGGDDSNEFDIDKFDDEFKDDNDPMISYSDNLEDL